MLKNKPRETVAWWLLGTEAWWFLGTEEWGGNGELLPEPTNPRHKMDKFRESNVQQGDHRDQS